MTRVFLASRNAKKLAEMERILAEHLPGVEVLGLDDVPAYDEPVEDQPDLRGQRAAQGPCRPRATGLPPSPTTAASASTRSTACRACCPPAGRVRPRRRRRATTRCCSPSSPTCRTSAAGRTSRARWPLRPPGWRELVVHGRMDGRIVRELRGERRVRLRRGLRRRRPRRAGLTTAELRPAEKDAISHRGRALGAGTAGGHSLSVRRRPPVSGRDPPADRTCPTARRTRT